VNPTQEPIQPPLFVGVDVGGTNVKLGVVDDRGVLLAKSDFPTCEELGPQYAIDQAREKIAELFARHRLDFSAVAAVGLGTPGTMDIKRGMILEPPNMPGWRHFPIRDRLSAALGRPVTFANDANAAAFGEFWTGSAAQYDSMLFFTLGTGVGGGIVIHNLLVDGEHSLGGEVGHIRVDWGADARRCSCGRPGHLEAYSSATAIVKRAHEWLPSHPQSVLHTIPLDELTAKEIGDAAEAGDLLAQRLVDEVADYLARGIAIVANTIDPTAILFGGAMTFGKRQTKVGRGFLERIHAGLAPELFPQMHQQLVLEYASLGSDAGCIGAAGLARKEYRQQTAARP
jgi:glucokinase